MATLSMISQLQMAEPVKANPARAATVSTPDISATSTATNLTRL